MTETTGIRAVVVDDEQPARERLGQLLAGFEGVEVVGEAEDGEQAIERIVELAPDLVFLDIQMPGCSGMEVVVSLPSPRPKVIFCTAYDQYAVDAFELHAVDYLLKPINRARLEKAVERVRRVSRDEQEASIHQASRDAGAYPARFLAKRASRFYVVPREDVLYFSSEQGLAKLETVDGHYWMQPTLTDLEKRLEPSAFCRVSRAAIVNLDSVREVVPLGGGYGEVVLKNDARLEVSRRRFKPLMDRLSGS